MKSPSTQTQYWLNSSQVQVEFIYKRVMLKANETRLKIHENFGSNARLINMDLSSNSNK